jgi:hypothetical protein
LIDKRKLRTAKRNSPFFEIARLLVCLNHVASVKVNANHGVMWAAVMFYVIDCIADRIRLSVRQSTGARPRTELTL